MDEILNGGFPTNSINIIMGQPGTGKTIFAEQMVFHHASADDRPILYLTTLSEPVAKVLTYLQRFSFFDQEKIGSVVHYMDIGSDLASRGITALQPHIEEAIYTIAPKIIVVDSFKALHDLAESAQDMRRMLHKLTGLLTAYDTTVFLVGEYTDEHAKRLPEFAVADGIIQFLRSPQSTRDERFVRILKLRGSGYMEGLHGCRITSEGMEIFPRLVSPAKAEKYLLKADKVASGVEGFDEIVGGGLTRASGTLVAGPTGSGKTTFAMQFALEGVRLGERSLYVNFQENPSQLARLIAALGFDPDDAQSRGLELIYASPVELQIDSIVVSIFKLIEENDLQRVVIDSLGDLATASSDTNRLHDYIYSLNQRLVVRGVSSVFTYETTGDMLDGHAGLNGKFSNMADNILLLGGTGAPDFERQLSCLKARGSAHDLKPHRFVITQHGIKLQ